MRIVSPFHDYYDTAGGYGQDPSLTYARRTRGIDMWPLPCLSIHFHSVAWDIKLRVGRRPVEWSLGQLAFCGRVYPVFALRLPRLGGGSSLRFCWTVADIRGALGSSRSELKAFEEHRKRTWWSAQRLTQDWASEVIANAPKRGKIDDLHRAVGAPVVLLWIERVFDWQPCEPVVANPILRDLEFFRVVDPFTAFQEIGMYLGGVLGTPEMIHRPIPDDALRDAKGFDDRSFKTDSPGRKKRRRQRRARTDPPGE